MSDQTIAETADKSNPVTADFEFLSATTEGKKLFAVRGGIPLRDAFEQLQFLIANAQDLQEKHHGFEDVPQHSDAAHLLLEFAYSLTRSMQNGLIEYEKR